MASSSSSSTERVRLLTSEPPSRLQDAWNKVLVFLKADKITKEQFLLALSVSGLIIATAGERVTFKMAVDRMVPFRFVMVQLILTASLIIYGTITNVKQGFAGGNPQTHSFPHSKLFIMAMLDTIQFAGLAVSAAGVSPTMTVILLHASTPCLVLGTRYGFPDRKYSLIQMRGVQLIALAVMVSLFGSISHQFFPDEHESDTYSSLVYVSMAALHGLATLYKEREIISWAQPMDIHYLSSWLFLYQSIITLICGPLIYYLQGLSSRFSGFPISSFLDNFGDGLACYIGDNPDYTNAAYEYSNADCSYSFVLILGYVISNVVVLECIDRVLRLSNQILGRATAAAVFVAFLALGLYDTNMGYEHGILGTAIDYPDLVSIVILLIGMEIYGHDPEPDVEAITNYTPSSPPQLLKRDSLA